jgi:AcrR family transcriptional regulator
VPRPRLHSVDAFLDAAADLVIEDGRDAITVRRLGERLGASNGSIYHAFGSIESVLGQSWLRSARQFLAVQRAAADDAAAGGGRDAARRAVLAAADAPAAFAERDPRGARLLAALRRDDLLAPGLDAGTAEALLDLDRDLVRLMRHLAELRWSRRDGAAVDAVRTCVVVLPGALVLPAIRASAPAAELRFARRQLAAAVDAVLACGVRTAARRRASG